MIDGWDHFLDAWEAFTTSKVFWPFLNVKFQTLRNKARSKFKELMSGYEKKVRFEFVKNPSDPPAGYSTVKWFLAEWAGGVCSLKRMVHYIRRELVDCPTVGDFGFLRLPLKPDVNACLFLGRAPVSMGDRPTRVCIPGLYAIDFANILNRVYHVGKGLHDCAVVSGNFATNLPYFQNMASNPSGCASKPPTREEMRAVVRALSFHLRLPKLPGPNMEDALRLDFKPKAHPGFRFMHFLHETTKLKAARSAYEVFKYYWGLSGNEETVPNHFWTVGAREKRIEDIKDGEPVKTRGVLMPEFWFQMFESVYSRPVELSIQSFKSGCIYLGHGMSSGGYRRYAKDLDYGAFVIEGDFRGYDTTLQPHVMASAFGIIRACYPDLPYITKHFLFLASGFINKFLVIPGGFVYKLMKGIPSGSSFTSLVGSLGTAIVLMDMIIHYPLFKRRGVFPTTLRMCVSGDDFVISCGDDGAWGDFAGLKEWIYERHGMDFKVVKAAFKDLEPQIKVLEVLLKEDYKTGTALLRHAQKLRKEGKKALTPKRIYADAKAAGIPVDEDMKNFDTLKQYTDSKIADTLRLFCEASNATAKFLKTILCRGLPSVPFSVLYSRLLAPNTLIKNRFNPLEHVMGNLPLFPLPEVHCGWVYSFIVYLNKMFILEWDSKSVKKDVNLILEVSRKKYFELFIHEDNSIIPRGSPRDSGDVVLGEILEGEEVNYNPKKVLSLFTVPEVKDRLYFGHKLHDDVFGATRRSKLLHSGPLEWVEPSKGA